MGEGGKGNLGLKRGGEGGVKEGWKGSEGRRWRRKGGRKMGVGGRIGGVESREVLCF